MWLFNKYGFYSAVCARQGDGRYANPFLHRIMMRVRVRIHLDTSKERFAGRLGDCEIQELPGSDYAFRIFVEKQVWSQVFVGLHEEVDYDNFNSEVVHHQGKAVAACEHSLHEAWSVMHRLQK